MPIFNFRCVPKGHRFALEIETKDNERNLNDPNYKRIRPKITCPNPDCDARADKGQIEDDAMQFPVSGEKKMDRIRKDNREHTIIAKRQAAEALAADRRAGEGSVAVPYINPGEGGRSRFGGGNINAPKKVLESLNEKGKSAGYVIPANSP